MSHTFELYALKCGNLYVTDWFRNSYSLTGHAKFAWAARVPPTYTELLEAARLLNVDAQSLSVVKWTIEEVACTVSVE